METRGGWCTVCQHGVRGEIGKLCPDCLSMSRSKEACGILKTPEQATKEHLAEADAIKIARKQGTTKGYKGMEELGEELKIELRNTLKEELRREILAELKAEMPVRMVEKKVEPEIKIVEVEKTPETETKENKPAGPDKSPEVSG